MNKLDKDSVTGIAALLVHAAKIDEHYTGAEKEIIKKALIDLYKIDLNKSDEILKIAEEKEQQSNHIIEFTREIKKNSIIRNRKAP